jgi:hypothetical protein
MLQVREEGRRMCSAAALFPELNDREDDIPLLLLGKK